MKHPLPPRGLAGREGQSHLPQPIGTQPLGRRPVGMAIMAATVSHVGGQRFLSPDTLSPQSH